MRIRLQYVVLTVLMLSLGDAVTAVERKPKSNPSAQQPSTPTLKPKDSQGTKPKAQPAPPKKFDDFIDKNKNGVDDRKENPKK